MSKELFLKNHQRPGETYAGIMLDPAAGDYHLFIAPGEIAKSTWYEAEVWAASIGADLPTRREQHVLFANAKEEFTPNWYWSSEQRDDCYDYAWNQYFHSGNQYSYLKSFKGRARAVRRLYLDGVAAAKEQDKMTRTQWFSLFSPPARDGLYECAILPSEKQLRLMTFINGAWYAGTDNKQYPLAYLYHWRGLVVKP